MTAIGKKEYKRLRLGKKYWYMLPSVGGMAYSI